LRKKWGTGKWKFNNRILEESEFTNMIKRYLLKLIDKNKNIIKE
jgi:hypothetical protein